MQHITIIDYLLLPVYLYIFYILVKKRAINYTDDELRKIFFTAFFLRMFGSFAYSMMVQYYYGYGDSFMYYTGSNFLRGQLLQDAGNIKYFFESAEDVRSWYDFEVGDVNYSGYYAASSNLFVMKISALVSFLAFNKFLIISIIFGFFSFAGQWRLFLVFNDINKGKYQKLMAWAVLYTPSIWFWGSGLMKEAICLGGLGFIVHFLYKFFVKKKFSLRDLFALIFLIYIVGTIKSYIIIILAVSLSTIVFYTFIAPFKNIVIKSFVILIFIFSSTAIAYVLNFAEQLQILAEESKAQVDTFQKNYQATEEEGKGTLSVSEIDGSLEGMILHSPVAIFNCLFRPFIWESRKIVILFTSLESMLLLLSTLYLLFKMRFFGFFAAIFGNRYLLFSFTLSMLFALIIGFTTYNFGTMVRYKIMLMPFYYFMLVQLYTKYIESRKALI
ncbi:MAG: hypothetical protein ABIO79_12660 [Ferruginibacter sp.]